MARSLISRLSDFIPVPLKPDRVTGTLLSPLYGPSVSLPDDYLEFMSIYGPGWFTEHGFPSVQILDLIGQSNGQRVTQVLHTMRVNEIAVPEVHPFVYPKIPGLLPWGIWDQGFILNWLVTDAARTWRVAVDTRDEFEWYEYAFSEYLWRNLAQQPGIRTYLMPEDSEIRYCPTSRVDDCCRGEYKP